ncbi:serine/threonine-protein kinase Vps15p [Trichomonascus vanleenenianus]|uniref:ubiquitin-binding serine/threonine protein kinase VPS15 n=1 Tax=Trichomonascus vanleenenianus TaxID=2268995 RepID=UPI003ECB8BBD
MGSQLSILATPPTVAIDAYLAELGDIQYDKIIGNARFMKTLRGLHEDGLVVVKVFIKPSPDLRLSKTTKELKQIRRALLTNENAVIYSRIVETERAGYLVRQHFRSNLYDRISTRPFLEDIEKNWITYQLLHGLAKCEKAGVFHGDIKSENVLVTSWNWVYLTDFAPYKPVFLPEDDPSQFSFYFDTSQRRSCYVAPERFLAPGESKQGALTHAMDVFSLGCVIAELYLEGTPIFTLAQTFKYRKEEYTPPLDDIDDPAIRSLVASMTELEPSRRLTASEYLEQWKDRAFPRYFYTFLHRYIYETMKPRDPNGSDEAIQEESDFRIDRIWADYASISKSLDFVEPPESLKPHDHHDMLPVCLDLPGEQHRIPHLRKLSTNDNDNALMIIALICSSIRNTLHASSRIKACELLLALGERIHDEAKLDRCLPYLVSMLDDPSENVQVAAVRNLAHLLDLVGTITPVNGSIFPDYIFPRLEPLLNSPHGIVRSAYAFCLSSLAQTASRFLDMGQVLKSTGMIDAEDPETENGFYQEDTAAFDTLKQTLSSIVEDHATVLLTDPEADVRRAMLRGIVPLCMFFGKQKTNDVILSHLITYLNDNDPYLRAELFDSIVGLAPFVGVVSLEHYIIPLMIQTLADPVELVVEKVLQSFTTLSELGMIRLSCTWDLLKVCAKFFIHPNTWIRNSTITFLSSATRWMSPAQVYCILLPIIRPYLECDVNDFTEANLINNAKPPLSRAIYERALTWASKAQKSLFWRIDPKGGTSHSRSSMLNSRYYQKSSSTSNLSAEDEQWLSRLNEIGLKNEDMWMLIAFKEHIYRVARLNHRLAGNRDQSLYSVSVKVQSIGVLPRNVFFDSSVIRTLKKRPLINKERSKKGSNDESATKPVAIQQPNSVSVAESPSSFNRENSFAEATRLLDIRDDADDARSVMSVSPAGSTFRAQPVTATTTTEAYGVLGRAEPFRQRQENNQEEDVQPKDYRALSSYTGNDPYIWKFLESVYTENVAIFELPEFGPQCRPFRRGGDEFDANDLALKRRRRGKPLGILVSNFEEHTGPINCVRISPDHLFFVTASDDGSLRVWDTLRLETNVINKSVQSMNLGAKIASLCFIDSTYALACGTSDGFIKLVRVEATSRTETLGPRYKGIEELYSFELSGGGEYAVAIEHVKTDTASYLCIATSNCRIVTLDLRTMAISDAMRNPQSHGVPTCMVIDRKKNWLLLGTSYGILDLYDLRFKIRVKSWTLPEPSPIYKLKLHPKANGKWVCVSGGTKFAEVSVWDIETMECKEIYRADSSAQFDAAMYTAKEVEKELPDGIEKSDLARLTTLDVRGEILALEVGTDFEIESSSGKRGYIVTGGQDRIVRFWDLNNPESSAIISGLRFDSPKPVYNVSHPKPRLRVVNEHRASAATGKSGKSSRVDRLPRTTVIAVEQLDLGQNHTAAIMDMAILLRPYEMIVTVDRAGDIKVTM